MVDRFKDLPARFPLGIPPDGAVFGPDGIDLGFQPKWNIPDKIGITCHVTGQPIKRARNPNQPYTADEIRKSAMDCLEAGARCIHIHARSDEGNFVVRKKDQIRMLHSIVDPIRAEYGDSVYIDGCICVDQDWPTEKIMIDEVLDSGMFDTMPLNPGTVTPPRFLQAEAEYLMSKGIKPGLGLHEEDAIDVVRVYLIDTGILEPPLHWGLLPCWSVGGTLYDEIEALDYLARSIRRIRHIDPNGLISIGNAGRPSYYLTGLAILMGLSIRVGLEDSYWKWPHKDELLTDTVSIFKEMKLVAEIFGRQMATADEYRLMSDLPAKG